MYHKIIGTETSRILAIIPVLFISIATYSQKTQAVGRRVTGDFNGDGVTDTAYAKMKTNAKTKAGSWSLSFSDKTIPPMSLGCCDVVLINEGNLSKGKATAISVFQAPENGCVYRWTTYVLKSGRWTALIPTFLVPTDCENFTRKYLEDKVFEEKGKVYYWDIDLDDSTGKPIKKPVKTK
jgi:hypothetical protein